MTSNELGQALRSARFRSSMTQGQLAARLHIDRTFVSKIETGEKEPRFTLVKHWLDVTNSHEHFVSLFVEEEDLRNALQALDKLQKIESILA